MMSDRAARDVLLSIWHGVTKEDPALPELQIVQAIGRFEGGYGAPNSPPGWPANNWGAVQCRHGPPCVEGECSEIGDTHADGSSYRYCYRIYPTPEAGAAHLVRLLTVDRPNVLLEAKKGSAQGVAEAMRKTGYFEAPADKYAKAIYSNAKTIAANMGEQLMVSLGTTARSPLLWIGVAAAAVLALRAWGRR